jgi:hypothetical protein
VGPRRPVPPERAPPPSRPDPDCLESYADDRPAPAPRVRFGVGPSFQEHLGLLHDDYSEKPAFDGFRRAIARYGAREG